MNERIKRKLKRLAFLVGQLSAALSDIENYLYAVVTENNDAEEAMLNAIGSEIQCIIEEYENLKEVK